MRHVDCDNGREVQSIQFEIVSKNFGHYNHTMNSRCWKVLTFRQIDNIWHCAVPIGRFLHILYCLSVVCIYATKRWTNRRRGGVFYPQVFPQNLLTVPLLTSKLSHSLFTVTSSTFAASIRIQRPPYSSWNSGLVARFCWSAVWQRLFILCYSQFFYLLTYGTGWFVSATKNSSKVKCTLFRSDYSNRMQL